MVALVDGKPEQLNRMALGRKMGKEARNWLFTQLKQHEIVVERERDTKYFLNEQKAAVYYSKDYGGGWFFSVPMQEFDHLVLLFELRERNEFGSIVIPNDLFESIRITLGGHDIKTYKLKIHLDEDGYSLYQIGGSWFSLYPYANQLPKFIEELKS